MQRPCDAIIEPRVWELLQKKNKDLNAEGKKNMSAGVFSNRKSLKIILGVWEDKSATTGTTGKDSERMAADVVSSVSYVEAKQLVHTNEKQTLHREETGVD